jgi:hypothetical protein
MNARTVEEAYYPLTQKNCIALIDIPQQYSVWVRIWQMIPIVIHGCCGVLNGKCSK